jgi:Amino acid permease
MQLMSAYGPFIYAGCFAATLSTAMTNLLSVPRIIEALGNDGIYPGVVWFAKPYGAKGEPFRGYVLTLLVAEAFVLIGKKKKHKIFSRMKTEIYSRLELHRQPGVQLLPGRLRVHQLLHLPRCFCQTTWLATDVHGK